MGSRRLSPSQKDPFFDLRWCHNECHTYTSHERAWQGGGHGGRYSLTSPVPRRGQVPAKLNVLGIPIGCSGWLRLTTLAVDPLLHRRAHATFWEAWEIFTCSGRTTVVLMSRAILRLYYALIVKASFLIVSDLASSRSCIFEQGGFRAIAWTRLWNLIKEVLREKTRGEQKETILTRNLQHGRGSDLRTWCERDILLPVRNCKTKANISKKKKNDSLH